MSPDRQRLVLALGQLLFQVVDVLSALAEAAVGEDALLQRDVGLDAVDDHFAQRHAHAADGLFAVGAVDDQLADHRVVVRRHAIAFVDVRIHAHAGAAGGVEVLDQAGRGNERLRVLGVDAEFAGVAALHPDLLHDSQLPTAGYQQLIGHQVSAADTPGTR